MREIKFRMYDRKAEIMSPVHLMEWGKIQNNLFYYRGYYDCEKNDCSVVACNDVNKKTVAKHERNDVLIRRYELMQYTGLKDKNGVYIYEGDIAYVNENLIICRKGYHVSDSFLLLKGIDLDDIYGFYLESPCGNWHINLGAALRKYNVIVIGNIYENPELLK